MPDTFKVYATNQPEEELEVDAAELIDLSRQGLLVLGKGDISAKGGLKRDTARDTPPAVTGQIPVQNPSQEA